MEYDELNPYSQHVPTISATRSVMHQTSILHEQRQPLTEDAGHYCICRQVKDKDGKATRITHPENTQPIKHAISEKPVRLSLARV